MAAVRAAEARGAVVSCQRNVTRRAAVTSITAVAALPGVHAYYGGSAFAAPPARRGVPGVYLGEDILQAAEILEHDLLDPARAQA